MALPKALLYLQTFPLIISLVYIGAPIMAQSTWSRSAADYYNRGNERQKQGDLDGALEDYTFALKFDPQLVQAWNNRGVVRYLKGELEQAIDDHAFARLHAFHDLPQAVVERPYTDGTGDHLVLVVDDVEDLLALVGVEGAVADQHGRVRRADGHPDAAEITGGERLVLVGENASHPQRAGLRVDLRRPLGAQSTGARMRCISKDIWPSSQYTYWSSTAMAAGYDWPVASTTTAPPAFGALAILPAPGSIQ